MAKMCRLSRHTSLKEELILCLIHQAADIVAEDATWDHQVVPPDHIMTEVTEEYSEVANHLPIQTDTYITGMDNRIITTIRIHLISEVFLCSRFPF